MLLLTRDSFRELVFSRDANKCVVCKNHAVDAHHIIDRKLFSDGGYYLDNGASLCSDCHIKAETNVITCAEIRRAAGIKTIVLPEELDPDFDYDKWGNSNSDQYSRKYGRTYHYPFSPGTTSDDRINHSYWDHIRTIRDVIHTEKLDGENTCLSRLGVFARSHAAPTLHPWADYLKQRWDSLKDSLKTLEVFGENLYAIHSIKYTKLEDHFFVFAIRDGNMWLSWEEVEFYSAALELPTVPVLSKEKPEHKDEFERMIMTTVEKESVFGSIDSNTMAQCSMEGIVTRNADQFRVSEFKMNVFKWVRKNHVNTGEHWSKKPRRATLVSERKGEHKEDNDKIIKTR